MNSRKSTRQRRGTILLIVVSLLALLFVIITGFLTIARNDRVTLREMQRGQLTQSILDNQRDKILTAIETSIKSANGRVLAGPGAEFAEIPQNKGVFIQSEAITSYTQNLNPPPTSPDFVTDFQAPPSGQGWSQQEWASFKRFWFCNYSKLDAKIGDLPTASAVWQLFMENDRDVAQAAGRIDWRDIENASRVPFMDADGNGMPDSLFAFQIRSIEEANAMAGTPVQLSGTGLNPSQIPPFTNGSNAAWDALHNAYVRWRELARFDVSTTVRSNGAWVALDAPRIRDGQGNLVAPWNRWHTIRMFDDFRSSFDAGTSPANDTNRLSNNGRYTPETRNYIFDSIAGEAGGIELSLHRRGGLPPAPLNTTARPPHAVPAILAALQGEANTSWPGFPSTFVPQFRVPPHNTSAKSANWDRINLQSAWVNNAGSERFAAVNAAQLSPQDILIAELATSIPGSATSRSFAARGFERRPVLTAISNSDEISRKLSNGDPIPSPSNFAANYSAGTNRQFPLQLSPTDPTGYGNAARATAADLTAPLPEGSLKFYLGEIAKGVMQEASGPLAGVYRWQRYGFGSAPGGQKIGDAIIERLARIYYDMLSQHDGWNETGVNNPTEVLSRRKQAFHLAVNTAQAAMPRSPANAALPGFVDTVTYEDGFNNTKYIGYGPQPYISEVLADVEFDGSGGGGGSFSRIALGVELFNPNDPFFVNYPPGGNPAKWQTPGNGPHDVFAMPVEQYAISFGPPSASPIAPPAPGSPPQAGFYGTLLGTFGGAPGSSGIKFLNGRCFYSVVFDIGVAGGSGINTGLNNALNNLFVGPVTINQTFNSGQLTNFEVRLWKLGVRESSVNGGTQGTIWYLVDEVELDLRRFAIAPQGFQDGHNWRSRARDATPTRRFGAFDFLGIPTTDDQPDTYGADNLPDTFARWNMPTSVLTPDVNPNNFGHSLGSPVVSLGNPRFYGTTDSSNARNPDLSQSPGFSPNTPLILMNAGPDGINTNLPLYTRLNNLPMFGIAPTTVGNDPQVGDLRPRSYPTVGFMHFIPRFAHALDVAVTGGVTARPASWYLHEQWNNHAGGSTQPNYSITGAGGLPGYPADLGHMPIFDNSQPAKAGGVFDDGDRGTVTVAPPPGSLGKIPWGMLVYDYFTTLDPATPGVDPLRVAGRTNINQAQWNVLAQLPVIGPALPNASNNQRYVANAADYGLPIRGNWPTAIQTFPVPTKLGVVDENCDPSPSFWDPRVGVLAGKGSFLDTDPVYTNPGGPQQLPRLMLTDIYGSPSGAGGNEWGGPEFDQTTPTRWRLGKWLAISAAAYRDGVQNLGFDDLNPTTRRLFNRYADAYLRNPQDNAVFRAERGGPFVVATGTGTLARPYRNCGPDGISGLYRGIRGSARAVNSGVGGGVDRPTQFGFVTIGELLNVKGWDSSRPSLLPPYATTPPATPDDNPVLGQGDFVKAVSMLALLDSQVLTTRTNTFTAYVSVMDRENPEASVRAQFTIDRSNILPRLSYEYTRPPSNATANWRGAVDKVKTMNILGGNFTYGTTDAVAETPVRWTAPPGLRPTIMAEKRIGYFNTRFDD